MQCKGKLTVAVGPKRTSLLHMSSIQYACKVYNHQGRYLLFIRITIQIILITTHSSRISFFRHVKSRHSRCCNTWDASSENAVRAQQFAPSFVCKSAQFYAKRISEGEEIIGPARRSRQITANTHYECHVFKPQGYRLSFEVFLQYYCRACRTYFEKADRDVL